MMEAIGYVWEQTSDYFWWSAIFSIAALAFGAYLMVREKEPIWSIRSVPNALIFFGIIGGGYLTFTSNDKVAELDAKARNFAELRKIEEKYGRWAKLTSTGFSLDGSDSYVYHALKSAFPNTPNGQISPTNIDCTESGKATLKKAIDRYPDFPFSYVYLAGCYGENHSVEWREYAQEAMRILENTTQVIGHHRHHDRAYELILKWLRNDASQSE